MKFKDEDNESPALLIIEIPLSFPLSQEEGSNSKYLNGLINYLRPL